MFVFISGEEREKILNYKLKTKSKRLTRTLAVAVAGFVSAASASVTYQINPSEADLETFNVTIDGDTIGSALAGGIQITKEVQTGSGTSLPSSYVTVCTDIQGTLYLGQSYVYNTPVTSFSGQTGVNPTWGAVNTPAYVSGSGADAANAAQAIQNAAHLFYTYGQLTSTGIGGTPEQMAALQLAVWEALYDTTSGGNVVTTGGRLTVSGGDAAAVALANTWLSGLDGSYGLTGYLLYPSQKTGVNADGEPPQELLIAMPVPEASTVIAGALLMLPFAASTFKILRKKRSV
jgi:hypothetical protein